MAILANHPRLAAALSDGMVPKFLATRSPRGEPNLVPLTSLMPATDAGDRLVFGNFLLRKSIANLDADARVAVLVMTEELDCWALQGTFGGWQRTGPYVDAILRTPLMRYNAYTGIRNAGIVDLARLVSATHIPKPRVLAEHLLARAAARTARRVGSAACRLPLEVRRQLAQLSAIKAVAYLDERGAPLVVPALSLQPAGASSLVCALGGATHDLGGLASGGPVAACLLTPDVVSFQIKGRWLGARTLLGAMVGGVEATSAYACGPPVPGRQVA